MTFNVKTILMTSTVFLVSTCGANINTGRNGDPSRWPTNDSKPGDELPPTGSGPGTSPGQPPIGEGSGRGNISSCFQTGTQSLPSELAQFCQTQVKPVAQLSEIYKIVCEQGKLLAVLKQKHCGWDGNIQNISKYMHSYYMQTDTAKDYEDIGAGFTKANVPVLKFITPIRLAFENYEEFKSRGFQWVAGTREHVNLNQKTWEQGVEYRFRADKGSYEIGYNGINQLHQITPTLYAHINYATGNFERIAHFAQLAFHQQQDDQSTVSFRIEHRRISSQGLYARAKKSAEELAKDIMDKGYKNAVK